MRDKHTLRLCSLPDCGRKYYALGLCSLHYGRLYKTGSTDDPVRIPLGLAR